MTIYVDGENLVHYLVEILTEAGRIKGRDGLKKFDVASLIRTSLQSDDITIKYYTTRLKKASKEEYGKRVEKRSQKMLERNSSWITMLQRQGIDPIHSGTLRLRMGPPCKKCKHQELIFQEKGVDVRLAVDLVLEARKGVLQIIFSSDSDLIPAVKAAKQRGSRVKNIAPSHQINRGLAQTCGEWHGIGKEQIIEIFDKGMK